MVYTPASLVTTGVATPVATFKAVTVALTTWAAEGSVTVPETLASVCWANASEALRRMDTTVVATWTLFTLPPLTLKYLAQFTLFPRKMSIEKVYSG